MCRCWYIVSFHSLFLKLLSSWIVPYPIEWYFKRNKRVLFCFLTTTTNNNSARIVLRQTAETTANVHTHTHTKETSTLRNNGPWSRWSHSRNSYAILFFRLKTVVLDIHFFKWRILLKNQKQNQHAFFVKIKAEKTLLFDESTIIIWSPVCVSVYGDVAAVRTVESSMHFQCPAKREPNVFDRRENSRKKKSGKQKEEIT